MHNPFVTAWSLNICCHRICIQRPEVVHLEFSEFGIVLSAFHVSYPLSVGNISKAESPNRFWTENTICKKNLLLVLNLTSKYFSQNFTLLLCAVNAILPIPS